MFVYACVHAKQFFFLPEASFYPGLNDVASILDVQDDNLAIPDEAHFEDEDDWFEVPSAAEVSRVATRALQVSKFSEAVVTEVRSQYVTYSFTSYSHSHRDQSGRTHVP